MSTSVSDSAAENAPMDDHTKKILEVKTLMRQREASRKNNDFTKSDIIRDKLLKDFNVEIFDQKNGPSGWKFKDGASKKLAAGLTLPPEVTASLKRDRSDNARNHEIQEAKSAEKAKKQKIEEKPKPKVGKEPVLSEEQKRNKQMVAALTHTDGTVVNKQGVQIEDMIVGTGKQIAVSGKRIKVHYVGRLKSNNKMFDSSVKKPFAFRLGRSEVIRGWDIGCEGMAVGGKRRLTIPPEKAYGRAGAPPSIPPNATLVFEVTLLEVM